MSEATPLAGQMRGLADSGHARAPELREHADAFEAASRGFYAEPQTHSAKQMLGAWARARRVWCECSGEPVV